MSCSSSGQATSIAPSTCSLASLSRVEENVPLARHTTIGTGGPARWFARPETIDELQDALRWAKEHGVAVETIGLGSNVLAHDDGVDALVLKLSGELARIEIDGAELVAGGGAANAVALHRARAEGLGGFEFASAIPGTTGGGVRMNAGAYGREFKDVLVEAVVVDADYVRTLTPIELGLSYRHSAGHQGEVVAEVRLRLQPSDTDTVKARAAELLAQRKSTQPTNKRTFGSVFKNPDGGRGAGRLIEECGLKGHSIGGALISPRHANFIENADAATSADCIALMAEARRRVRAEFGIELDHEVQFLGPLELPPL
jgi:UDP-N-acetylenolpyruvoylglucosamine reductase